MLAGGALVDRTLMLQFGARSGDRIRIGDLEVAIVGALSGFQARSPPRPSWGHGY